MNNTPTLTVSGMIESLTTELNRLSGPKASVLDGTPFIIVAEIPGRPLNQCPMFGDFSAHGEPNKHGFRYQNRNDLCGVVCKSPESAERAMATLKSDAGQDILKAFGAIAFKAVHRSDWERATIDSLRQSLNHCLAFSQAAECLFDA